LFFTYRPVPVALSFSSNIGDVLSAMEATALEEHTLTVANLMEYAVYLHHKEGFYVFNDEQLARIIRQKMAGIDGALSDEKIQGALQTAAAEYINWLLEQTGATRPPLRAGGTRRKARKGNWADVTGNLAAHYKSQVDDRSVTDHTEVAPEPDEDLSDQVLEFPEN